MSDKCKINGIDIHYQLLGQGKPLVLIAGFSCDHSFWSELLDSLTKHYQVLLFDNRGVGQTTSPDSPYTVDLMADDTLALIEALGLKKPSLIGQSMGAAIAQSMVKRYAQNLIAWS